MIDPSLIVSCSASATCSTVHAIVMSLVMFLGLMGGFAYTTWLERRLVSKFQNRVGPNRAGWQGLLQPIADGLKLMVKEDVTPSEADKPLYWLAPVLKSVPVLIVLGVVPLGPPILLPWFDGLWYEIPMGIADVNVGVLYLLAVTSLGTYGVVLAGWASGSKYSMYGGLRSSAQMISYELSLGLAMMVPIMIAGSMSIGNIIEAQADPAFTLGWFLWQNPLAAFVLMVALLAEVNRAPFDMPEAESELVGGYNTEYSGMKFALFFAGEYIGMIGVSAIASAMFFGGYNWPFPVALSPLLGPVNTLLKIILFLSGMVWVRATLPRIRYDRLMAFGWKVMFPLSLVSVAWSAIVLVVAESAPGSQVYTGVAGVVFTLLVLGFLAQGWRRSRGIPQQVDVTDSRSGLGWVIMQGIGAVVAAPFAIYDYLMKQRGGFEGFWDETRRQEAARRTPAAEAPAPESTESGD